MPSEVNSSGERLYKDADGVKCNIRGMIRREPEWVASRFNAMEETIDQLTDQLARAEGIVANAPKLGDHYVKVDEHQKVLLEMEELKAEKQSLTTQLEMFDDWFCCPECASYQINGISFDDDFGSHKCDDCGHCGEPGEDFPTTSKVRERLAKAEAVVEKLPVTADGVPVCPGDSGLYGTDADGQIVEHCIAPHYHMTEGGEYEAWHIEEAGGELHDRMYASHESYPDETWYGNVQFLYSTREAAEAALAARSEGGE